MRPEKLSSLADTLPADVRTLIPDPSESSDEYVLGMFFMSRQIKNLRPATLKSYQERLRHLLAYANEIGKQLIDLTKRDIEFCIFRMGEDGSLSPETINGRIRVWRAFYGHLFEESEDGRGNEGLLARNPMQGIDLLKTDKKRKPKLSTEEVGQLLNSFGRDFYGTRNKTVTMVLLDTMIRVGELINIKLVDVDVKGALIRIHHTKGRRERAVPLSRRTLSVLNSYIAKHRKRINSEYLFCDKRGLPLTISNMNNIYQRQSRKLGFRVYPHLIRHTGASMYANMGGPLPILQQILGHADIRTTQVYLHAEDADAVREHHRFSPMNQIR